MISNKFFMLCKIHWKLCAQVVNFYLTRKCHNRTEKMRKEKLVYCIVFHQTATHKNKILPLKEESLQHKNIFFLFQKKKLLRTENKASEKVIVDNEIGERDACCFSFLFCLWEQR